MFGDPHRGPMPGAQGGVQVGIAGQGQQAAGGHGPVPLEDDRAVMGGVVGPEQGDQQFLGDQGVQLDGPFQIIGQADMALHDDEGADAPAGQGFGGFADFFDSDRGWMPPGARAFLPTRLRTRRMSAWKRMITMRTKLLTMMSKSHSRVKNSNCRATR